MLIGCVSASVGGKEATKNIHWAVLGLQTLRQAPVLRLRQSHQLDPKQLVTLTRKIGRNHMILHVPAR